MPLNKIFQVDAYLPIKMLKKVILVQRKKITPGIPSKCQLHLHLIVIPVKYFEYYYIACDHLHVHGHWNFISLKSPDLCHLQLTIASGEAQKTGFSQLRNSPISATVSFSWSLALSLLYSWQETGSFVFPHSVAFDLKSFFWPQIFDKMVLTFPGFLNSCVWIF